MPLRIFYFFLSLFNWTHSNNYMSKTTYFRPELLTDWIFLQVNLFFLSFLLLSLKCFSSTSCSTSWFAFVSLFPTVPLLCSLLSLLIPHLPLLFNPFFFPIKRNVRVYVFMCLCVRISTYIHIHTYTHADFSYNRFNRQCRWVNIKKK